MLYDMVTEFIDKETNNLNFGGAGFGFLVFIFIIMPICAIVVCLDVILLPIELIIWFIKRKSKGE
mgnify:CR=1 FL=1